MTVEIKPYLTNSEFPTTSNYRELIDIANQNNESQELERAKQIAPSVHRIARLRGRIPYGKDIEDIHYDASSFKGLDIDYQETKRSIRTFIIAESLYYKLAENIAIKNAKDFGFYERLDDFIDLGKEMVAKIVWQGWKPENGENYIDLHKRIVGGLRSYLIHQWGRSNFAKPYSYFETDEVEKFTNIQDQSDVSPKKRPLYRIRECTGNLPLTAIIANVENANYLERVAGLATLKYYPSRNGLKSIAEDVGVKKETLSSALDRLLEKMPNTNSNEIANRSISEIVSQTKGEKILKYPSGKNVEFDSPRIKLSKIHADTNTISLTPQFSEREIRIIELASMQDGNFLSYSAKDIASIAGCNTNKVVSVIAKYISAVS
jgi:hypothetical protein